VVIRVVKELGTGGDYSKQTFLSIAIGKIMRPFHRQAKFRPVAEPLSRAMSSVGFGFLFFMESTPLTKNPQHAQLAACRKKWSGVFYFLTPIKHNLYISVRVSRSALFSALGEGEIGTSISIFLVLCRNPPSNILCRFLTGYSSVLPSL